MTDDTQATIQALPTSITELCNEPVLYTESDFISGGITRRQLVETACRIKVLLEDEGRNHRPVCLWTEDRGFFMAAILAALCGGPDLVIPHTLSEQVVAEACRSKDAHVILSDNSRPAPGGVRLEVPDISKTRVKAGRSLKLERDLDRPFLWLYSGGSSDRPSLWSKTPLNLLGEALFLSDHFHITPQDLFLVSVPPQHIYGLLFSVLLPFVSRAGVVNDTPYFPGEIVTKADNARATVFIGSPMHYKALAARPFQLDTVRLAFSSGGFLEEAHSLAFSENTGTPVEEVYGSTETGGIASRSRWHGEDAWKPFPVVEWKTRDERLLVKSPFISPELAKDAEGYFMTGDRVGVCNDGRTFDLYGRADRVVKVGGNRVDLEAVEEKLKTHTGVKDVYVFQVAVQAGRENGIAALVVYDGTLKSLKDTMRETLSPFEIPRHIRKVSAIPSTGTGKRDREAALRMVVDQKVCRSDSP